MGNKEKKRCYYSTLRIAYSTEEGSAELRGRVLFRNRQLDSLKQNPRGREKMLDGTYVCIMRMSISM